jgi:D-3-phosphoglycerate dehydrogenase / 2-oxoglutarate reductase
MDILISEELDSPAVQKLSAKYKVERRGALWKDPVALKTAIASARAIMVRNQTQLTAEVLAAAPKLVAIGRVGVGLDNIDVPAATKSGVVVIAPLDANATSVAELAMGFALALARKIPLADRSTKAGGWDRKGCTGVELEGKTFAICGFGRIGRKVAAFAGAFGMKTVVFDPFVKSDSPLLKDTGAQWVGSFEEAIAGADFITTHSPLTPETKRMFNARTFGLMKRGAFFINTSRGGVVDEAALLEALRSGQLGGAALDVREQEPPAEKTGLEQLDNVILAPHVGAFTAESQTRTFEAVAGDVDRVLSGQPAKNFVNMARPTKPI